MALSSPSPTERCHDHRSHCFSCEKRGFRNGNAARTAPSGVALKVTPPRHTRAVSTLRDTAQQCLGRRHAYEVAASQRGWWPAPCCQSRVVTPRPSACNTPKGVRAPTVHQRQPRTPRAPTAPNMLRPALWQAVHGVLRGLLADGLLDRLLEGFVVWHLDGFHRGPREDDCQKCFFLSSSHLAHDQEKF